MTGRRSRGSRRWAIIASAVVGLSLAGLAIANAAQLSVTNTGLLVGSEARCTEGPVAITGGSAHSGNTYTSVSLTDLDAACVGASVQLTVYDAAGTALATGTGTAGASPFDITTTSYTSTAVAGVALLVGTWGVPTTWTPPVVVPTACTSTPITLTPANPVGGSGKYRDVGLSTVDPNCVGLAVTVTFSDIYGGAYTASGTVLAGASFTLPTGGQYRSSDVVVASISLTIDAFAIPFTWTP